MCDKRKMCDEGSVIKEVLWRKEVCEDRMIDDDDLEEEEEWDKTTRLSEQSVST